MLEDGAAARHAFRVASGLDSMVLGEPQILGQMKEAVREADEAGALGTTLHQLFQRSFAVAKEVRSSTEIGAHSISMAAAVGAAGGAAVRRPARRSSVLFVGAGEMIELVGHALRGARARSRWRSPTARWSAARSWPAASAREAMRLADLPAAAARVRRRGLLHRQPLPIIGLGAVERALKARKHRPMFMVDLAVPRDIEPEVGALADVYLYTVDDLVARGADRPARSARPRWRRPRPSSTPACRASCTGSTSAPPCR